MCSQQDLPFLNPACYLCNIGSRAVYILLRITQMNTLLVMDSSVIPLQCLQRLRFPFFCSLTISLSPAAATTVWPFIPRASNMLFIRWMFNMCIHCQLASFSHILSKVGRTTTHWSYYPLFYLLFNVYSEKHDIVYNVHMYMCV